MSLKKLWRAVKGMHGRQGATGVSDFKSWAAMELKASLLWNNAFYYNEEGSEISDLAKELKVSHHSIVSFVPIARSTYLTHFRTSFTTS